MAHSSELPMAERPIENVAGHWVLARLGKRVLRPGGRELTERMLGAVPIEGRDVVELAPGLGLTARAILAFSPASYTAVDENPEAAAIVRRAVGPLGRVVDGDASHTGLADACADVVVGEAMLTMQTDRGKRAIITEAVRLLRPGGRSAIHELGLTSDDIDDAMADGIRQELVGTIRVNARPLTEAEWRALLTDAGLVVDRVDTAPMALLQLRRNIADEGVVGTLRIVRNVLRDADARRRVLAMRKTFTRNADSMTGIALVARLPAKDTR